MSRSSIAVNPIVRNSTASCVGSKNSWRTACRLAPTRGQQVEGVALALAHHLSRNGVVDVAHRATGQGCENWSVLKAAARVR